ncbi:hypothetical protein ACIXNL_09170 [Bacteroides fragilis]
MKRATSNRVNRGFSLPLRVRNRFVRSCTMTGLLVNSPQSAYSVAVFSLKLPVLI